MLSIEHEKLFIHLSNFSVAQECTTQQHFKKQTLISQHSDIEIKDQCLLFGMSCCSLLDILSTALSVLFQWLLLPCFICIYIKCAILLFILLLKTSKKKGYVCIKQLLYYLSSFCSNRYDSFLGIPRKLKLQNASSAIFLLLLLVHVFNFLYTKQIHQIYLKMLNY